MVHFCCCNLDSAIEAYSLEPVLVSFISLPFQANSFIRMAVKIIIPENRIEYRFRHLRVVVGISNHTFKNDYFICLVM